MSDDNSGSGMTCIGVILVVLIVLLILGLISFGDIWNVIKIVFTFLCDVCGLVCGGILALMAVICLILGVKWITHDMKR